MHSSDCCRFCHVVSLSFCCILCLRFWLLVLRGSHWIIPGSPSIRAGVVVEIAFYFILELPQHCFHLTQFCLSRQLYGYFRFWALVEWLTNVICGFTANWCFPEVAVAPKARSTLVKVRRFAIFCNRLLSRSYCFCFHTTSSILSHSCFRISWQWRWYSGLLVRNCSPFVSWTTFLWAEWYMSCRSNTWWRNRSRRGEVTGTATRYILAWRFLGFEVACGCVEVLHTSPHVWRIWLLLEIPT